MLRRESAYLLGCRSKYRWLLELILCSSGKGGVLIVALVFMVLPFSIQAQTCKIDAFGTSTTPTSRFISNTDQTITDTETGLMWKKCLEGVKGDACRSGKMLSLTWNDVLRYPQKVNNSGGFAGYMDWRLPTVKELLSIVEKRCLAPAINLEVFQRDPGSYIWSVPSNPNVPYSWVVKFEDGSVGGVGAYIPAVRLVRVSSSEEKV